MLANSAVVLTSTAVCVAILLVCGGLKLLFSVYCFLAVGAFVLLWRNMKAINIIRKTFSRDVR